MMGRTMTTKQRPLSLSTGTHGSSFSPARGAPTGATIFPFGALFSRSIGWGPDMHI
jgi:hypothetical protein